MYLKLKGFCGVFFQVSYIWYRLHFNVTALLFSQSLNPYHREHIGSVVECLTLDQGPQVRASLASLCCFLEQDTFILA